MITTILSSMAFKIGAGAVAVVAPLFSKKVRTYVADKTGSIIVKGLSKAVSVDVKDEYVNGRLQLALRCFIDIADHAMPDALGEEKKAWVMKQISSLNMPPVVNEIISALIDDLVARSKAEFQAGNSKDIDNIIADAVEAIKALPK